MDVVRVTVLRDATEAEMVCGLLRTAGIEASHRHAVSTDEFGGWTEVLVAESDLEAARELLPRDEPY
jgi:Putative prokaryotic signal transducing protein